MQNLSLYFKKVCYTLRKLFKQIRNYDSASISNVKHGAVTKYNGIWKKYGWFDLYKAHLCADNLLDDIHIGAAQELIKKQFLCFGGLQTR